MSFGLSIKVTGEKELAKRLRDLKAIGQQPVPMLEAMAQCLQERIGLSFDTKTDPNGKAWAKLRPSTRARYDLQDSRSGSGGRSGTLLERTGLMRASLTRQALSRSVLVGFGRAYAVYHEFGTNRMARRALIFANSETGEFSEGDRQAILKIATEYLKRFEL
jgi:phage gpG-like protein